MKKLLLTITILFTIFLFSCPAPKASGPSPLIGTAWQSSDSNYEYSLTISKPADSANPIGRFYVKLNASEGALAAVEPVTLNGRTMTLKGLLYNSQGYNILLIFTANSDLQSGTATIKIKENLPTPFPPLSQTITLQRKMN